MDCNNCTAYGIDSLNFRGCLIKHEMLDKSDGKVGCYLKENTIKKRIEDIKKNEPREKYYKWINETK